MPRSRTRASSSPAWYGRCHVDVDPEAREHVRDPGAQRVDPEARRRAHRDRAADDRRCATPLPARGGIGEQVDLVERDEARLVAGAQLFEHLPGRSRRCSGACGSAASTTSSRTSARVTSSRVARNASISWCGSLWMKPTVSVTIAVWPSPSLTWRLVGSSVANSLSSAQRHLGADERVQQRALARVRVADDRDRREQAPIAGRARSSRAAGGRARRAPSSS